MTYQQAGRIAILKRVLGWVIFIPAVISTIISVLKFMYDHSEKQAGINAVMLDFAHVMIEMMRFNTPFLNLFWVQLADAGFPPKPQYHVLDNLCVDLCGAGIASLGGAHEPSGAFSA